MGEDNFNYPNSQSTHSFPVKIEDLDESSGMAPYHMGNPETYCAEQKEMTNIGDKSFHEDMIEDYNDARPQLHHMPSLSTTCTSDSFHGSLPSGDSGDAYDLNCGDVQDFEWPNPFQWPPNRIPPHLY
jgi:hypothetical protein